MGAWLATGLAVNADQGYLNSAYGGVSFNGDLYFQGLRGALYRSLGGVAAFTEVAASPDITDTYFGLYAYLGKLYSVRVVDDGTATGAVALLEWSGGAWVQKATLAAAFETTRMAVIFELSSSLWFVANKRAYQWNGVATLTASLSPETVDLRSAIIHSDGLLYCGSGQGGQLYRRNANNTWTQVAPTLSGFSAGMTIFSHGGVIYGLSGLSSRLLQWTGSAWTPITASLGTFNQWYQASTIALGGRVYFTHNNDAQGTRLYSWTTGEAAFRIEAAKVTGYRDCPVLVVHNSRVYGPFMQQSPASENFSTLYRFKDKPENSALFPASTGKPSHARILRGYRSPDQAAAFHQAIGSTP